MFDRPGYFTPPPSSTRWQPQEQQQSYQFSSGISSRDRDPRLAGRLSPELEIMRPVSPFQAKRQLPHQHQQPQSGLQLHPSHTQSSYHQPRPSQTHAHAHVASYDRVPPVLEMTVPTSASTGSTLRPPKPAAYKETSSTMRGAQKDSDISPALRMMSYETSLSTPPTSDVGHGPGYARTGHATATRDRRAVQESRGEFTRPNSPDGGRRRNPGWRKPVPRYIPTPPSTPPPNGDSILSSAQNDLTSGATQLLRDQVPPPSLPAKATTMLMAPTQDPPQRPVRAETAPNVPVMFRELTTAYEAPAPRPRLAPLPAAGRSAAAEAGSGTATASADAAVRSASRAGYAHAQRTQTYTHTQAKAKAAPAGPRPVPAVWKPASVPTDHQAPTPTPPRPSRTYAQAASSLSAGASSPTTTERNATQTPRSTSGTAASRHQEATRQTAATTAPVPSRQADAQRLEATRTADTAQPAHVQAHAAPVLAPTAVETRPRSPVGRQVSEARVHAPREHSNASAAQAQHPHQQLPVQAHPPIQASQTQTTRTAQASTASLLPQVPQQAHLHSHVSGQPIPPVSTHTAPAAQAVSRLAQGSTTSLPAQVASQSQAHLHPHAAAAGTQYSPRLVPRNLEARTDSQRSGHVHPPPRKVPSIAQLVAKVLPSATPSPRVSERSLTIDDHSVGLNELLKV